MHGTGSLPEGDQAAMEITRCRFGRITIDGVEYDKDVIIHGGRVHPNWWREKGHRLSVDDLAIILEDPPEVLVVGRGHMKLMRVPRATRRAVAQRGIELIEGSTPEAVARLAELLMQGRRVSAGFHLAC